LKAKLKRALIKYNIQDIIVFGSYVKGKSRPKDIDINIVSDEKDLDLFRKLKEELNNEKIHINFLNPYECYKKRLWAGIIMEGFSIKENEYLRDIIGITPMKLYSYSLINLTKSKKVLFNQALDKIVKKVKGERIGAGTVLIPTKESSDFEDFLDVWDLKYRTKEWNVF